ncbi:IclR family transcriptional regulator C-terminal domain-containing protein [Terrilactibacillus sp. S3-3]|nr:IclR family transcriptional regulator C-terminal domain-containing protein [Terrilactibacillus sp. S3-3]
MIIKIVNTNPGFNIGAQIGTILPLTSSAGKIFLAFADEIITHSWRERESRKRLPDQLQNLDQEIRLIQRREIAFTKEPIISSISSISIPVFNYGKKLLGAVVIVGFNEQIPTSEEDETSKYIKEMGKEISKIFGYEKSDDT